MEMISDNLKNFLSTNDTYNNEELDIELDNVSVYELATSQAMTVKDYASLYPKKALYVAEKNVAFWNRTLSDAIMAGNVNGNRITKNVSDLFKLRLQQANDELTDVRKYIESAVNSDSKTDRIVATLYNRAVENGDTRALMYLMDRVDGKIGQKASAVVDEDYAYAVNKIIHSLFIRQLKVLNGGYGTHMCCCGRRSGKTHLAVAGCLIPALSIPNTTCLYIGRSAQMSKRLFSTAANRMIDNLHLTDKSGQRLNWKKIDNGSEIITTGMRNSEDPDKLRGLKAQVIVIDEFMHLNSELLKYALEEVLQPMQADYGDTYKMLLIGSPPKHRKGFGEYAWNNFDTPHYEWTIFENPTIKDPEKYIQNICKTNNIDRNSSFIMREYMNKWVYEDDYLLFPDYYTYDPSQSFPNYNIDMVDVGIDYGNSDYTAVVGVAWETGLKRGYVFYEKKFNNLTVPHRIGMLQFLKTVVAECWERSLSFFSNMSPIEANRRIRWSADSTDQILTQELNRDVRLGDSDLRLQIIDAHRTDRSSMEDKMKDLLRTKALLLPEGGATALECELTSFKLDDAGNPTRDIDHKKFHPDILSALRYALWGLVGRISINTLDEVVLPADLDVVYGGTFFGEDSDDEFYQK